MRSLPVGQIRSGNMIKRGFSRLKACARVKVRSQRRRSGKTSFSNVGALKAISFEALCNVRDRGSAHKTRFKPGSQSCTPAKSEVLRTKSEVCLFKRANRQKRGFFP